MSFKVSTTGTLSPVVLNDLGGRSLTHPTVDLDLELEFSTSEIGNSVDIQAALTAGHISVAQDPPTNPGDAVVVEDVGGSAGLPAIDGSQLTGLTHGQLAGVGVADHHARPVQATEATIGLLEIAAQPETDTGTDDIRAITPLKLATTPRLPTQSENNALVGTVGSPATTNKFATNEDERFEIHGDLRLKRAKTGEDWAIALPAASGDDSISGKPLKVFQFDDTLEEGVGYTGPVQVPSHVTKVQFHIIARAEVAPVAARTVGFKVYTKSFPDNAAPTAWSTGLQLTDINIPINTNWQYDSAVVTLAALGVTVGELVRFEWTRVAPLAGTNLVGDWTLLETSGIGVRFF